MKSVAIIGAGGHTRTLINILELLSIKLIGVYDETVLSKNETILGYPVYEIAKLPKNVPVIISKGDVEGKLKYSQLYSDRIFQENIIHPKATIESKDLGKSNHISSNCYLTPTSSIGNNNIIYSGTMLEHECKVGNDNIITVNVSVCGRVTIGNKCFIGAGAVLLPNISICDDVVIGAGAVVAKNIETPGTYVGTPAKKLVK